MPSAFRPDLFRGTAEDYERYRVPYPASLTDHLLARVQPAGRGRLLDLGCGTGQVTFALRDRFAETWAVDQEPDMIELVRAKAKVRATQDVHAIAARAEELDAPAGAFELVTIGNAFHRLDRESVAANIARWLAPGGHVALLWSSTPWMGTRQWQRALSAVMDRWRTRLGAEDRVPAGWARERRERPDQTVLEHAGLRVIGSHRLLVPHAWSLEALTGLLYSTSMLPRILLADQASAFEADLHHALDPHAAGGELNETIDFAYELARRPE